MGGAIASQPPPGLSLSGPGWRSQLFIQRQREAEKYVLCFHVIANIISLSVQTYAYDIIHTAWFEEYEMKHNLLTNIML